MKRLLLAAMLFASLAGTRAMADVTVINQIIANGQTYTVPAGKYLVVSHCSIANNTSAATFATLFVKVPGAAANEEFRFIAWNPMNADNQGANFNEMPLVPGTQIRNSSGVSTIIIGKLMDPGDLFATIDAELTIPFITPKRLFATLYAASTRPVRIKIETSTDMVNFETEEAAIVLDQGNGSYEVRVPKNPNDDRLFVRAQVAPIPLD